MRAKRWVFRLFGYFLLVIATLISIFPFVWAILTSIKLPVEILSIPLKWIPTRVTFSNYVNLFTTYRFTVYFTNSLIIALSSVAIGLSVGLTSAYGFSRFKFKGKEAIFTLILVIRMIPPMAIIIPVYLIFQMLNLIDTYLAVSLMESALQIPFVIWLMRSFYSGIPEAIEESALIDGCTRLGAFLRITLPLSMPGIAVAGIFTFLSSWKEFLFPLILASITVKTIPLGMADLVQEFEIHWGELMAGSVIFTIPILIFASLFLRHIEKGLAFGAVKG